jgi:hypothetical protein
MYAQSCAHSCVTAYRHACICTRTQTGTDTDTHTLTRAPAHSRTASSRRPCASTDEIAPLVVSRSATGALTTGPNVCIHV